MIRLRIFAITLGLSVAVGCSPQAITSYEAVSSTVVGGVLGAGVGAAIGTAVGETAKNVAVNSAIGAGAGLLVGAMINEMNRKQRVVVVRQAETIGENQKRIDALRKEVDDSTKWGQGEIRSWDQRYLDHNPNYPYQGAASVTYR